MPDVTQERYGGTTVVTLNRPDVRNAISPAMMAELAALVAAFEADAAQRVLVVTGAGDRAFSAGADLSMMLRAGDDDPFVPISAEPDIAGIGACRKPTIAAINGLAVGAGMELAMCCDIRLAADDAWFGLPEAKHGFLPGVAAVLLPRLLPLGVAMDMMLAGERLDAATALRLGFVQQLWPREQLLERAIAKAARMESFSQPALAGCKRAMRFWHDAGRDAHHLHYAAIGEEVLAAGDVLEGLAAFRSKRPPTFGDRG